MNVVFLKACSPKSRMARRLQLSQHYRKLVRPWMFRFPGCSTINQKEISSYNQSLTDNSVLDMRKWAILMHYRSEEHTSELQSRFDLVCRLLLEKKKTT